MSISPELRDHKEWLGYLQPVGLVVAPPALLHAQAIVSRNVIELQQALLQYVAPDPADPHKERVLIQDLRAFFCRFLGWDSDELQAYEEIEPKYRVEIETYLPEYEETLHADFALAHDSGERWQLLMMRASQSADLDRPYRKSPIGWDASPQARIERLLRETGHDIGLLTNDAEVRLVYAPRGESPGHLTFPISAMTEVSGRLILGAFHMLLEQGRIFHKPEDRRLESILQQSRTYQSEVSNQLAEQVLAAMIELLQGFQSADASAGGRLLDIAETAQRQDIYGGLLTTLLRLVFLLYAEDRGLMPDDPVYVEYYAVSGLFEKLREDVGRYPDTMDQRYGAWAQLISLFRVVYDGGGYGDFQLPRRYGKLFDPDAYPFLEGRPQGIRRNAISGPLEPPRISDGVIYRVLSNLLIIGGERISYRALDVEQIGSVYEAMMGFTVEAATGASIAVKPHHVVVDLDALLAIKPKDRPKILAEQSDCKLSGKALDTLNNATTPEDIVAALERKVSPRTPLILPAGSLFLQPGEERRKTGSHYTPRALTSPIVESTLRPIFAALGQRPTPEQILDLKICDPAMGSGAFLVETCRQLAEKLVDAWNLHNTMPTLPPDEDPLLHARRVVAQRCLYGVDKNPFAVDLAKLSLWLVTLAKDHPFTFLDHALKCGDSLVGLSRDQINNFHWATTTQQISIDRMLDQRLFEALEKRQAIYTLEDSEIAEDQKRQLLRDAEDAQDQIRTLGDLIVYAFFSEEKTKQRDAALGDLQRKVLLWRDSQIEQMVLRNQAQEMRERWPQPVLPFHWEIEFPEVFLSKKAGFDAMIGNPPFAGKNTIAAGHHPNYLHWLKELHEESHGNADLVAHFFRRVFHLLQNNGTMGLIATNTLAQGDTRTTGLRWICTHGGTIYEAQRRFKWPGLAAVVVSIVMIHKGPYSGEKRLDGRNVDEITAFLFHAGGHENPHPLQDNAGKSFQGSVVLGMGFTFDDTDTKGAASPLAEMHRLIEKDPRNAERIFPYIGGSEVNTSPTHSHHRYVINFGEMSEAEARQWPDLMQIVEEKVKPERMKQKDKGGQEKWWQFLRTRPELRSQMKGLDRVLVIARVTKYAAFSFLENKYVFNEKTVVFPCTQISFFSVLQSRIHEIFTLFFSSSLKDDINYAPSDCFETFPFPLGWEKNEGLEKIGEAYYQYRAEWMVKTDKGLTETYNRFHDPEETSPEILKLRALHEEMDRAVLEAYGWGDIPTGCEFLLDYEEEEEESNKRKKPYRYRWPEEVHDEVLARLLALNQQRHDEESR